MKSIRWHIRGSQILIIRASQILIIIRRDLVRKVPSEVLLFQDLDTTAGPGLSRAALFSLKAGKKSRLSLFRNISSRDLGWDTDSSEFREIQVNVFEIHWTIATTRVLSRNNFNQTNLRWNLQNPLQTLLKSHNLEWRRRGKILQECTWCWKHRRW